MKTLLSKEQLHDGVTRMADEIAGRYEDRQLDDRRRAHWQRRPHGRLDSRARTSDAGRRVASQQLPRGHDHSRRTGYQLRADARYFGPRRAAGRRYFRHRPHADAVVEKMHEFGPTSIRSAVLLRKHGRRKLTIGPISWRSTSRMNSSSAMASTTKICTATCPTWRRWSRKISRGTKRRPPLISRRV